MFLEEIKIETTTPSKKEDFTYTPVSVVDAPTHLEDEEIQVNGTNFDTYRKYELKSNIQADANHQFAQNQDISVDLINMAGVLSLNTSRVEYYDDQNLSRDLFGSPQQISVDHNNTSQNQEKILTEMKEVLKVVKDQSKRNRKEQMTPKSKQVNLLLK